MGNCQYLARPRASLFLQLKQLQAATNTLYLWELLMHEACAYLHQFGS